LSFGVVSAKAGSPPGVVIWLLWNSEMRNVLALSRPDTV
jgi:hypothetical protein